MYLYILHNYVKYGSDLYDIVSADFYGDFKWMPPQITTTHSKLMFVLFFFKSHYIHFRYLQLHCHMHSSH